MMRAAAAVAAAISIVLTLSSPARAERPKVIGTWKLARVTTPKGPVPKDKLAKGSIVWTFEEGGGMTITVTSGAQSKSGTGTWSMAGDQLTVTETGAVPQRMTWKVVGAWLTLTGSDGKVKLELERQRHRAR